MLTKRSVVILAGSTLAAGLVAGLIKGWSIERALQLGLAQGESVIKYTGAKRGLLNMVKAQKIIKNNPGKIK